MEKNIKKEWIYIHITKSLSYILTPHCKSTILQEKREKKRKKVNAIHPITKNKNKTTNISQFKSHLAKFKNKKHILV